MDFVALMGLEQEGEEGRSDSRKRRAGVEDVHARRAEWGHQV